VAVSTGLLPGMSSDEVDSVLAHEVSPVANGDMLAQVVLVQERGLKQLQNRIESLEQEVAERPQGGGFLGGLFGGGQTLPTAAVASRAAAGTGWSHTRFPAQGGQGAQPGAQGGGFMAGAMQTAMGVAGRVLLANALGGIFGDEAQAAEPPGSGPRGAGSAGGGGGRRSVRRTVPWWARRGVLSRQQAGQLGLPRYHRTH